MKRLIALGATIFLFGCDASPSLDQVANSARDKLQHQLDVNFDAKNLTVQKIEVVLIAAPKYDGAATIVFDEATATVPVSVTSDGKTTIVVTDGKLISSFIQASQQRRIDALKNHYSDYVLGSKTLELFPASLKQDKADFSERLQTVSPIKRIGEFYFGSGCKAHDCGSIGNAAAWIVNRNDGSAAAIIMKTAVGPVGTQILSSFRLYGSSKDNIPAPLIAWGIENGMNAMNVVEDAPTYQAPPE